jgi:lauroyl-KDO2-lipid IV(A) myristoyltransferase
MEPHQRPALQRRFFRPRYWPTWVAFGALWLTAWLPTRIRAVVGDALAAVRALVDRKRMRIILTNLALCYPNLTEEARRALARSHLRISTRTLLDTGVLMFRSAHYLAKLIELHGVEALITQQRPLILLSPHCVALEHCGLRTTIDRTVMTMIRRHNNPVSDWIVTRMRTRFGGILFRHDASLLSLVRAARQGAWFYYLPDEDQGHASAVFAPFKGVPKATVPILGRLAQAAGALVVPTRSAFDPATGRYSMYADPPVPFASTGDASADARALNALLEPLIDADPAQYLWTQKIFRTRPPGTPSVY